MILLFIISTFAIIILTLCGFIIRNNVIHRIRSEMIDWCYAGPTFESHSERLKIFESMSYSEMLNDPKHWLKWSFKSFYDAQINMQLLKE